MEHLARRLPRPEQLVEEAEQRLDDRAQRLVRAKGVILQGLASDLQRLGGALISPARQIAAKHDQFEARVQAFARAFSRVLEIKDADLKRLARVLESVSYQRVLDRGFALVTGADDAPVLSAKEAKPGDDWRAHFLDGVVDLRVTGGGLEIPKKKPRQPAKDKSADPQGTLL